MRCCECGRVASIASLFAMRRGSSAHARTTQHRRERLDRPHRSRTRRRTITSPISPTTSARGFPARSDAELAVQWTTQQFRDVGHRRPPREGDGAALGARRGARAPGLAQRPEASSSPPSAAASPRRPTGITADVIEVTSYEQLEKLGRAKIRGQDRLLQQGDGHGARRERPRVRGVRKAVVFRGRGASRAAEYGAVAAVIRSVASASLRTPHTGSMRYDEKQPKIPAAAMTTEDADLVHRLLAKGERVRMHLVLTPRTLPDVASANVIAEIRGSERPDEIVLDRRPPRLVGPRHRRDRQRLGLRDGHGDDARAEGARHQAEAHHPRRAVHERRERTARRTQVLRERREARRAASATSPRSRATPAPRRRPASSPRSKAKRSSDRSAALRVLNRIAPMTLRSAPNTPAPTRRR